MIDNRAHCLGQRCPAYLSTQTAMHVPSSGNAIMTSLASGSPRKRSMRQGIAVIILQVSMAKNNIFDEVLKTAAKNTCSTPSAHLLPWDQLVVKVDIR
jgi:hypothetical protein